MTAKLLSHFANFIKLETPKNRTYRKDNKLIKLIAEDFMSMVENEFGMKPRRQFGSKNLGPEDNMGEHKYFYQKDMKWDDENETMQGL